MITPLTITSLDQGKELARRQVERLYAEPAVPALELAVEEVASTETVAPRVPTAHRERRSFISQFLSFLHAARPVGVWRL